MALEEYSPNALRIIMNARGLNAGDVSRRTRGNVARTTVRNLMLGEADCPRENVRGNSQSIVCK
jgi:hypothetical protein